MNQVKGEHQQQPVGVAQAIVARAANDGIARHHYLEALLNCSGPHAGRDFADAVHLLCALHGHHPGLIGLALERCPKGEVEQWLGAAAESFERERLYLVRLAPAVGPIPSTPGAAQTEAGLNSARHALETLALSERSGCALGAASALIADWWAVRRLLDRAATRAGIETPASTLPNEASVLQVVGTLADSPTAARALAFGSEQLLLQHRALMDLLEARADARGDY
jgi:hypothetical protein